MKSKIKISIALLTAYFCLLMLTSSTCSKQVNEDCGAEHTHYDELRGSINLKPEANQLNENSLTFRIYMEGPSDICPKEHIKVTPKVDLKKVPDNPIEVKFHVDWKFSFRESTELKQTSALEMSIDTPMDIGLASAFNDQTAWCDFVFDITLNMEGSPSHEEIIAYFNKYIECTFVSMQYKFVK